MSFSRFRKGEKSKASSVQSNQDYKEAIRQQDNLSHYSQHSQGQNEYKPRTQIQQQPKPKISQKYNNDINNLQRSEHNSQNPSITSSSSAADQYICNNCINDALIYEKQLNSRGNDYSNGENPLDIQHRMGKLERDQINNKISARQGRAAEAGKHLGEPTNKDKLIQEYEKGPFFLYNQQEDPQMKKVLDNYYKNDERNRGKKPFSDKPGVDDYYRNYVDNYKDNYDDYGDEDDRKAKQDQYNKDLRDQIEKNKKLRNLNDNDNKKYQEELKRQNDKFEKEQEEEAKRIKDKQNEMLKENLNLIEAKRKKAENDKMLDDYDQRRNAANLKKQMEDEEAKMRQKEDAKRKGWQKDLDNQIKEKNQKAQLERDRNQIPNINAFTHEDHECCENGKCCICKRIYPLSVLNPKKKYASLARIQKMRKKRENEKKGQKK